MSVYCIPEVKGLLKTRSSGGRDKEEAAEDGGRLWRDREWRHSEEVLQEHLHQLTPETGWQERTLKKPGGV